MVYSILTELESTNSRLEKEAILKREVDNINLKDFFRLALDPFILFYQKKIPHYNTFGGNTLRHGYHQLTTLSDRFLTGNDAIAYLSTLLSGLDADDAKVIERIIEKDPKCGVSEKTVNKIWNGLIPEYPCLLASKQESKLLDALDWDEGVIIQLKSDGMRCNIIVDHDGNVEMRSRNGRLVDVSSYFSNLSDIFRGFVLDGELLVKNDEGTGVLDRKTGNGICNKALKGTIKDNEASRLFLNAWDLIPYDTFKNHHKTVDATPYEVRFGRLQSKLLESPLENVQVIESKFIKSFAEATDVYQDYVARGEEGAIIKCPNSIWENKRSKGIIKMKEVLEAELECIGIEEGTGKYEGKIGSLICRSGGNNPVLVNVGTGLTDADRELSESNYIGRIVSVKYNAVIETKTGERSLFLPVFVEVRSDKTEADVL